MSTRAEEFDLEPLHTLDYPELGTGPVSVEAYVSPEYFRDECAAVFAPAWLLACHTSDIPNAGDYVIKNVAPLNASIIIVRGRDDVVRGFHNVCRHRGNQLIHGPCKGRADNGFVCGFHSWTYGLDGRLRGVPDSSRFFNLDKSSLGLVQVAVETLNDWVFFKASEHPKQDLSDYLGKMGDALSRYDFSKWRVLAEWSCTIDANWKVCLDAFQEGYHVGSIHKYTAPSLFTGPKNPFTRHTYAGLYGPHRQLTVPMNPDFVPSATEAVVRKLLSSTGDSAQSQSLPSGLNPGGKPNFGFDINAVFPSSLIDPSVGGGFTLEFMPESVSRTHWTVRFYQNQATRWSQRIGQELISLQLREALLEDLTTLEATQRGLQSKAIKEVIFSDQEIALRHSHHITDSLVRQYRDALKSTSKTVRQN
jgi:glycine betaine catabolism A